MQSTSVPVADVFQPVLDAALTRLRYLHPGWGFEAADGGILVSIPDGQGASDVEREIAYALYRERILSETMDMRRSLLDLVGGR
ncbi:hypothetical protein [Oharaeibacter diazotrophicus]|uniref:Uncharacterized protein n=1 Tax=Oharaeibacter diazotrophicus TaxID=1920512 RepID=A0A4R6RCQ0_9HYPH|nr:hypothetical protein [Oharaeibacter diazotrophicus]TDP83940.1 hypothetical protein EDD54_2541 [Oharaeibacter diazotrophicus]BBE72981.1 hypothetical protein OHA_1_02586 [Pleomorphomonas sp. SM30]GLS74770.1 hypothetical protein GCM10007904_01050 [Oharaeibacter diazotrophicus]